MAAGEKKVSLMAYLASVPDDAKFYIVLADGSYGYTTKADILAGIVGGSGVQSVTGDIVDITDPDNPVIGHSALQQVFDTGRNYYKADGDWEYTIFNFEDDGGEKLCLVSINNSITGQSVSQLISSTLLQSTITLSGTGSVSETSEVILGKRIRVVNGAFGTNEFRVPFQTVSGSPVVSQRSDLPTGNYDLAVDTKVISSNYTAVNGEPLSVVANATITDPTGVSGKGYTVYVPKSGVTATIGGVGYGVGSFVFRFYDGSGWVSKNYDVTAILATKANLNGSTSEDFEVPTTPAGANSAISKNYFDNAITGITWKQAVKCSTTANHALSGTSNVDGVTIPAGTRVLVRFQTAPAENGIYITASGAWSRASDADTAAEVEASTILVQNGTLYKQTQWTQSNAIATLGTDAVSYAQISGAGTYTASTGLSLTANVFSIISSTFGAFITSLSSKNTLVDADTVVSGDSAASGDAKKTTWLNVWANYIKPKADLVYQVIFTAANFGSFSNGLTGKTTPVNADTFNLSDSADSNNAKKVTWSNIKATLAAAFFLDATSSIQGQINNTNAFDAFKISYVYSAGFNAMISDNTALSMALSAGTTRTQSNTNAYTMFPRYGNVTAASAGSVANYRVSQLHFLVTGIAFVEQSFGTSEGGTTSGMRFCFGISTSTASLTTNIEYDTLTNFIGIGRLSSSNNLHIIHNDGSGTATVIDLGSNFPVNTIDSATGMYKFRITPINSSSCTIYVERNGTAFTDTRTISTDIPALDQLFTLKGANNNNANAVACGVDLMKTVVKF